MNNFILSIIKQSGIPSLMISSCTAVEELVICSIELVDSLTCILCRMRMYNIKQHTNTHTMCLIYKIFQIFWHTTSRSWCEKAADLITKGTVVRMLHNSHNLNSIISKILYARKYLICKFKIRTNFSLLLSHTNMTLINIRRKFTVEILIRPCKWCLWIINLCTPKIGCRILNNSACIQWDSLKLLTIMLYNC